MQCNVDWWLNWQKLKYLLWPTRSRGALWPGVQPKWVLHNVLTKSIFHFQIMDFTMKSLRMRAKQSECCIMLWRKSIFHFWIMDFTMKSLTVSSNGRGVSREQNKISHGCADPSPPARSENNMDVNYGDDGDVYLIQSKTWGFWGPMYRQDTLYMNSKTLGLRSVKICSLANARFLASHFSRWGSCLHWGPYILLSGKLKMTD